MVMRWNGPTLATALAVGACVVAVGGCRSSGDSVTASRTDNEHESRVTDNKSGEDGGPVRNHPPDGPASTNSPPDAGDHTLVDATPPVQSTKPDSSSANGRNDHSPRGEPEAGLSTTPSETGDGGPSSVMTDGPFADPSNACGDYLTLWRASESERAPGEFAPPEDGPSGCFDCVRSLRDCDFPSTECTAGNSCVARHCLCTPEAASGDGCLEKDYPDDLCACIRSCFEPGSSCVAEWTDYMTCSLTECAAVCEE